MEIPGHLTCLLRNLYAGQEATDRIEHGTDWFQIGKGVLQGRLQWYINQGLPDVQVGYRKTEEPEIKLPTSFESLKKQESSRKTSTSVLLATPKPLTVWKILKEVGIPEHLPCPLRNLYAGQEATVKTRHATMDRFQIGKGVRQGCILLHWLFNLYAEYILQNARLYGA